MVDRVQALKFFLLNLIIKKTFYMVFSPKKTKKSDEIDIQINNEKLHCVRETKISRHHYRLYANMEGTGQTFVFQNLEIM